MSRIVRTLTLVALLTGVASDNKEKAVPVVTGAAWRHPKPRAKRAALLSAAEVPPSDVGTGITFKVKRQPPSTTSADKAFHMGDKALQRSHISRTVNAVTTAVGGASDPKRIFRHAGKNEAKHMAYDLDLWYRVDVPEDPADAPEARGKKVLAATALLKSDPVLSPSLDLVEPDIKVVLSYATNDPRLADQNNRHYDLIDLAQGWDLTAGHPDVVVQVIDSGIDQTHPDLQNNYWKNPGETNCTDGVDNDDNGFVDDCHGYNHADDSGSDLLGSGSHGTHCAGTIAADNDNGVGVAGVAGGKQGSPGASLMINTCFGKTGTSGFAEALVYGADNGAHVSSNSWGYTQPGSYSSAVLDAIDYADDNGTAVVFAAGNAGTDQEWYPGFYDTTIAVAATDSSGKAASFTVYGSHVDISAPGVNVLSTVTVEDGEYAYYSGTSMACPHVAGILALGKSFNPDAKLELLRECLFSSATDISSINDDKYTDGLGTGVANVPAFLDCVKPLGPNATSTPTPGPSPNPTPTPTQTPAPTHMPSIPPTRGPSPIPTPKPTYSPAPTPMPVACGTCDGTLTLEITTDRFPSEISWELDSDMQHCSGDALSGSGSAWGMETTRSVSISETLCNDVSYTWTLKDSFGDGICCAFGEGSYKLWVDGVVVHSSNGDYGSEDSATFTRGGPAAPAPSPTPAPVPAKTCTSLGWTNRAASGSMSVCGESDLGLGGCSGKKSWDAAVDFCAAAGARLCTAHELENDETRRTGCGLDNRRVWSSTKCGDGTSEAGHPSNDKYEAVGGSKLFQSGKKCSPGPKEMPVRCCADEPLYTCATLGWTNAGEYGNATVCGESDLGLGGCSGKHQWEDAVNFCAAAGARLCSADELLNGEAKDTGCGLNSKSVWSATECGGPGMHQLTKRSKTQCRSDSSKRHVRCCADV